MRTVGAGLIATPFAAFGGCTPQASFVAVEGFTVSVCVALVRPVELTVIVGDPAFVSP